MKDPLEEAIEFCKKFDSVEEISKYPIASLVLRLAHELKKERDKALKEEHK